MLVDVTIDLTEGHTISYEPDCDQDVFSLLLEWEGCTVRLIGAAGALEDCLVALHDKLNEAIAAEHTRKLPHD